MLTRVSEVVKWPVTLGCEIWSLKHSSLLAIGICSCIDEGDSQGVWGFTSRTVRATLHHIMRVPFQGHYRQWYQPQPTEIPSSMSLWGWDMTGPEHTYMQVLWLAQQAMDLLSHTLAQWSSSVYNQLAQGTCEGNLPGTAVILRDQVDVWSCARYNYIPHGVPMESGTVEHHQVEPWS